MSKKNSTVTNKSLLKDIVTRIDHIRKYLIECGFSNTKIEKYLIELTRSRFPNENASDAKELLTNVLKNNDTKKSLYELL